MCTPHLCLRQGICDQRKEVTQDRFLCLLVEFLPHCNGNQKSLTAWQRGKYFKDKILELNSQSG